jgi:hypothetical protein
VAAFRDKVWLAHPDRGGDEQTFIDLCSAYHTILKEVRPSARARRPAAASRGARPPGRPAPEEARIPRRPRKPNRKERQPKPPDSNWAPDLILGDNVGRNGQPAPPADPTWKPDLILTDEANSDLPLSQPRDPRWKPDVVLNEEAIGLRDGEDSIAAPGSAAAFRLLFRRIAAGPGQLGVERSSADSNQLLKAVLIVIFISWIVGTIWLGWVLWNEPDEPSPEATRDRFHTASGQSP